MVNPLQYRGTQLGLVVACRKSRNGNEKQTSSTMCACAVERVSGILSEDMLQSVKVRAKEMIKSKEKVSTKAAWQS
jgi:hypothetical protein